MTATIRDRIYRVNSISIGKDGVQHDEAATTTLPLKQELIENFTGVDPLWGADDRLTNMESRVCETR